MTPRGRAGYQPAKGGAGLQPADRRGGAGFQAATPVASPAFTLIELLVVISIIALLIAITLPQLGAARENSRQLKCLTNLKGIGTGVLIYLNDQSRGVYPYVLIQGGEGQDVSLLDLLGDYLDAPAPRKEDGSELFIVTDPYKCPSDPPTAPEFETTWRLNGTSYDYPPGIAMVWAEGQFGADNPSGAPARAAFAVTRAWENDRFWPFLLDAGDWHTLKKLPGHAPRNALYPGDWRADWCVDMQQLDWAAFFMDVLRFGGKK